MSQEYFSSKGKSPDHSSGDAADNNSGGNRDESGEHRHTKPSYMTVGSGSTSEHAARLQALLDKDSGYGGSTVDDEAGALIPGSPAWDSATQADRPLDSSSYTNGSHHAQAGAVHQLWYNKHRVTLERSINRVIELLKGLQEKNASWPAHYPTVQRTDDPALQRPSSRPGFPHTQSMLEDLPTASPPHPGALRRSLTSLEDHAKAESSRDAEKKRINAEPRLVTPQIAQEFSILKLDLKLGALHQTELVHSLEKNSIASLLDGKISSSIKHLLSLRERIEDRSSKVLVTGDLNAGKSTFCNAILRRKILPEDQQPCTSIFCEVLHASENNGIEEVHAVHKDAIYDRNDETTYDVFSIQDLEKLVLDNATYIQCKVYIKDIRTVDESLLNNGVVDIALIDAPGLNSDTTKTTALFARQEEIDVVVFVVSAANHFTMTAREFLLAAAAEKAYLFIVVNGFDMIRDQERCQKMILDQVRGLSPQTYKEASELVHFVSSNAIPTSPPPGGPDGGDSGSSSGGGGGDDPSDDPKGKGKDKEKIRDFEVLEQSLRRFVLEKRAKSKLTPAKNYLMNILNDVNSLATVNAEVAQSEIDRVTKELEEIEPVLESNKKAKDEISAETEKIIEDTCSDVYNQTRAMINFSIAHASDPTFLDVHYPGLLSAFEYAEEVKEAMLSQIAASVTECEESARSKTVVGVNAIKQLGILHLGDEYNNLNFRPDVMFRRRRDALTRQIEIPIELWDFLDWSSLLQRQEKVAGTGMALTVATAVGGRLIGGYGWMDHALSAARIVGNDNLRRLIVPAIVVSLVAAAGYVLNQIPQSLPQRLSTKISSQLAAIDYVHANSSRIAGSVRKVLRFPADSLREGLQRSVEQLGGRREETLKVRAESAVALKYFSNLVRDSAHQRAAVGGIDLDGHPPGLAH